MAKYFIWNKYTKELTLKRPLSYLAIFVAGAAALSVVVGVLSQFLG